MADDVQGRDLASGYIYPLLLRIGKFNGEKAIYRSCHHYKVGQENTLDLFRLDRGGRLSFFAGFNNVSFVEEIDKFPAEEVAPSVVEETPAEIPIPLPGKDSNDDFPF